jgi:hypothetical protein
MTDRISLTAAELAFLISVSGDADTSPAPRLLGFTAADRTEAVTAAGLGSLLLRHLVAPRPGQRVELAPALVAVAEGLARPRTCIQVSLVADRAADGALLFESAAARFLLAPRAYRCFDVTGVDPGVDRRDPLLMLAHAFLDTNRPGMASVNVLTDDPRNAWATVTVAEDDRWTFVAGRAPEATLGGLGADEALNRMYDELGALAPAELAEVG